jgi:hypothetical protein
VQLPLKCNLTAMAVDQVEGLVGVNPVEVRVLFPAFHKALPIKSLRRYAAGSFCLPPSRQKESVTTRRCRELVGSWRQPVFKRQTGDGVKVFRVVRHQR